MLRDRGLRCAAPSRHLDCVSGRSSGPGSRSLTLPLARFIRDGFDATSLQQIVTTPRSSPSRLLPDKEARFPRPPTPEPASSPARSPTPPPTSRQTGSYAAHPSPWPSGMPQTPPRSCRGSSSAAVNRSAAFAVGRQAGHAERFTALLAVCLNVDQRRDLRRISRSAPRWPRSPRPGAHRVRGRLCRTPPSDKRPRRGRAPSTQPTRLPASRRGEGPGV